MPPIRRAACGFYEGERFVLCITWGRVWGMGSQWCVEQRRGVSGARMFARLDGATTTHACRVTLCVTYAIAIGYTYFYLTDMMPRQSAVSTAISLASLVATHVSLLLVTFTDPGIVRSAEHVRKLVRLVGPRWLNAAEDADRDSAVTPQVNGDEEEGDEESAAETSSLVSRALRAYERVGKPSERGQCSTCKQTIPQGAEHCWVDEVCVHGYDHNCPWLGGAIGSGNMLYFTSFLVLTVWTLIISTVASAFGI